VKKNPLVWLLIIFLVGAALYHFVPLKKKRSKNPSLMTAKEAWQKIKPIAENKLVGKNARLGEIIGSSLDQDGLSHRWIFVYYAQGSRQNYLDSYSFTWEKTGIKTDQQEFIASGLSANYRQKLPDHWLDSDQLAKLVKDLFIGEKHGLYVSLYWDAGVNPKNPTWFVRKFSSEPNEKTLIDAVTGDKLN